MAGDGASMVERVVAAASVDDDWSEDVHHFVQVNAAAFKGAKTPEQEAMHKAFKVIGYHTIPALFMTYTNR